MPRTAVGVRTSIGDRGQRTMHLSLSESGADRYTADRTRGCRNKTRTPISISDASRAAVSAWRGRPRRSAARHNSEGLPVGSAAARSNRRRVAGDSESRRRRKLSSIRSDSGTTLGRAKPPARSASDTPRGNSSSARGFPCVSASTAPEPGDQAVRRAMTPGAGELRPHRALRSQVPGACPEQDRTADPRRRSLPPWRPAVWPQTPARGPTPYRATARHR